MASVAWLREKIVEHLSIHPGAADTINGIANWWLEAEEVPLDAVEQAVLGLVDAGVMERRVTLDGTPIYGLARSQ
jgi:hypothetical protein